MKIWKENSFPGTTFFGKAPVISLRLMLRLERKKFPKKAGRNLLCIYPFAMDTNGSFCDTSIHFLKKIAVVIFSNEPGSEPLLAWKRANWVQETCLLIQATVLRAARVMLRNSFYLTKGTLPHMRKDTKEAAPGTMSKLAKTFIPVCGKGYQHLSEGNANNLASNCNRNMPKI